MYRLGRQIDQDDSAPPVTRHGVPIRRVAAPTYPQQPTRRRPPGRPGATAPRLPRLLARLLPHLLVALLVGIVLAGKGFWTPALIGQQHADHTDTGDLNVPLNPGPGPAAPRNQPDEAQLGSIFTRPPLPITTVRLQVTTYTTKANDTPEKVARQFNLKAPTILWANGLQDPAKVLPAGTKLRIPPTDGMLHQIQGNDTVAGIAAKYRVEPAAITGYRPNNVGSDTDLIPNSYVLVPGGLLPTRERIEKYIVANGDTLWSIAERFGLQPSTLVWANSLTNADVLTISQPLIIPPVNGTIHRVAPGETLEGIADRYGVKPVDIGAFAPNGLGGGSGVVPGQDLIIPGGTPPAPAPPLLAENPPATAPTAAPAAQPTARPQAGTTAVGSFIWPATGALTTYFGDNPAYYGPGGHNGLDIANGLGTPLLAADGGVVIYADWRGGLGNAVGVDHENGFVTWYGHASSFAVSVGTRVSRGQVVAYMGSTGNSTGSHIHFIIVRNGVYVDPLLYLPR